MTLEEVAPEAWEDRVIRAAVPVLVDVWAPWCVPCRRVEPLIADVATRYGDRLDCVRLNADEAADIVARYAILSLPTVLLFAAGEEIDRIAGVPKPKKLSKLIDGVINTE